MDELLKDPRNKDYLYCPNRVINNCHCLEELVREHLLCIENISSPSDALLILKDIRLRALELYAERLESADYTIYADTGSRRQEFIISKSRMYINYVKKISVILRDACVCEAACKQILQTTNASNFSDTARNRIFQNTNLSIYCKLTDNDDELIDSIIWGKKISAEGECLLPFKSIIGKNCCKGKCTNQIIINKRFYLKLRYQSTLSPEDKRDAVSELLNTKQGRHPYCNKFLCWIIGTSIGPLKSIKREIRENESRLKITTENHKNLPINTGQEAEKCYSNTQLVNHTRVNNPSYAIHTTNSPQISCQAATIIERNSHSPDNVDTERLQLYNRNFQKMLRLVYSYDSDDYDETYDQYDTVDTSQRSVNSNYRRHTSQRAMNNYSRTVYNNDFPQERSINTMNLNRIHNKSNQCYDVQSVNRNSRPMPNLSRRGNWNNRFEKRTNRHDP
ncbi:hypothetical protein RF11_05851 [Thelohanellus kitauei]|uniref:Uncharacterized protein n=1 Tax=Thelohanellus kitauei TaxID=669202 RepID=A0A0C2MHJ9_THEKT|nr:hypothetical protein RF11_05851 [Thelohanellus kitauei]